MVVEVLEDAIKIFNSKATDSTYSLLIQFLHRRSQLSSTARWHATGEERGWGCMLLIYFPFSTTNNTSKQNAVNVYHPILQWLCARGTRAAQTPSKWRFMLKAYRWCVAPSIGRESLKPGELARRPLNSFVPNVVNNNNKGKGTGQKGKGRGKPDEGRYTGKGTYRDYDRHTGPYHHQEEHRWGGWYGYGWHWVAWRDRYNGLPSFDKTKNADTTTSLCTCTNNRIHCRISLFVRFLIIWKISLLIAAS